MDATKCLNNAQWESYALGKFTSQELAMLQNHLPSCEICTDVKEGIDAMAQPAQLVQTVANIHAAVDEKLAVNKGRILPIYYWLSAAVVLFVSMWVLYTQLPSEKLLSNTTLPKEQAPEMAPDFPESDLAIGSNRIEKEPAKSSIMKADHSKVSNTDAAADLATVSAVPQVTEVDVATIENAIEVKKEAEDKFSEKVAEDLLVAKQVEKRGQTKEETELVDSPKKQNKILPANAAMKSNNRLSDLENQHIFNAKNLNTPDSTVWKMAKRQFELGNLDSAQIYLSPLFGSLLWQEEAEWLQLKIYQKQNKQEAYSALLKIIASRVGKYQKDALILLK